MADGKVAKRKRQKRRAFRDDVDVLVVLDALLVLLRAQLRRVENFDVPILRTNCRACPNIKKKKNMRKKKEKSIHMQVWHTSFVKPTS